jgi:hypothetical protein
VFIVGVLAALKAKEKALHTWLPFRGHGFSPGVTNKVDGHPAALFLDEPLAEGLDVGEPL